MKRFLFLLVLILSLVSCRSPQNVATDKQVKEDKQIEKNIELVDTQELAEIISQAMQKVINEKLNINYKQVKYDTDKPVDPETGKPPVKEETNIDLNKETDTQISDTTNVDRSLNSGTQLKDKSKEKEKTQVKDKTKQSPALKWWHKMLIFVGFVSLSGFAIWLYFKIKK